MGIITLGVNYGARNSFGLFLRPLAEEFSGGRGLISAILGTNFLTYGAVVFLVGWLGDRFGPRLVLFVGAVLAAAAWWASALVDSLGFIFAAFGLVFGIATAMLSQVTCTSLVARYALGRSARLLGFIGMGPAIGILLFAPLLGGLISLFTWRLAMVVVGFFFAACLLLPVLGLAGVTPEPGSGGEPPESRAQGRFSLWPFISSRNFGLIFVCLCSQAFGVYMFFTQVAACAQDRGLGLFTGALSLGIMSGTGVVASPVVGWLTSRVSRLHPVGIGIFLLGLCGLILLRFAQGVGLFFTASFLVGIAYGGYVPVLPALTMKLYPREVFGRMWGLVTAGGCLGAGLGSWLGGLAYDIWGNYHWAWWLAAAALGLAAVCLLPLDEPPAARPSEPG